MKSYGQAEWGNYEQSIQKLFFVVSAPPQKKKKKGKVVAKLLVWLKSITFFEETKKILSDELALLLLT